MIEATCEVCGFVYKNEDFNSLPESWVCPVCGTPKKSFRIENKPVETETKTQEVKSDLEYPASFAKNFSDEEKYMADIHAMAVSGKTIISPMGTQKALISWDDILILGAQLNPMPLDEHEEVNVKIIVGSKAKRPMELENPVYISHMSFGALSKEMKIALSKGAAMAKTAVCSGEGGILPEEKREAYKYIFEYVPNLYSVTEENLLTSDAVEIKIGQGTKPGMGGHLPAEKVTQEIAAIRNRPVGTDIISPSKFEGISSANELKRLVDALREISKGRPIGIKIAAGHIERDLEWIRTANPDFITIDGRGGATGASPKIVRDSCSLPTIYALYRAKKYLREHRMTQELIITGGLRVSGDFFKAIAMGADGIAISSSALMAAACQQYRVCNLGTCPVGAAAQDPELRKRLNIEAAAQRLANYLNVVKSELETFLRMCGHKNLKDLSVDDLCTINREISDFTNIKHA